MNLQFNQKSMEDYFSWQSDKINLKKINQLLKDISRNPFEGIGKPEPLKGDLSGFWSRRINQKDRIIYQFKGEVVYIFSLKGHYGNK
jgi:toxin YoeB